MFKNLICPISNDTMDGYVSQLTIIISAFLTVIFIVTLEPLFLYISCLDYCIRAFSSGQYGPLRFIAITLSKVLKWNPIIIDKAPKVFISRLGFLYLYASSILININLPIAYGSYNGNLPFLFGALGVVCVHCLFYNHLVFSLYLK